MTLGAHFDQGPAAHDLDVLFVPLEGDPSSARDMAAAADAAAEPLRAKALGLDQELTEASSAEKMLEQVY